MSAGNESADRQQQKVAEFLRLLPLTTAIAGLPDAHLELALVEGFAEVRVRQPGDGGGQPDADLGKPFNEGQLEVRVNSLKTAYKLARQLILDIANR